MSVCVCVCVCVHIHTFTLSTENIKSKNISVAVSTFFPQTFISKHLGETADPKAGVGNIRDDPGISSPRFFF